MQGQLGINNTTDKNTPTQIGTLSDWSFISAGANDTMAIKTNYTLWGWGYNYFGELGIGVSGTGNHRTSPVPVIGTQSDWSKVAVGGYFTLAIRNNNTLWSWGQNNYGQLGLGNLTNKLTPCQVGNQSDWSLVSCSESHTIARKTTGTLWSWGYNSVGQLGLGTSGSPANDKNTPTQIGTQSDWSFISAGGYAFNGDGHSIATKTDKTIWIWGSNTYGQLGLGNSGTNTKRLTPTQIGTDSDWTKGICGVMADFSIGLKDNNTIWSWGYNRYGELGIGDSGTSSYRNTPTLIRK